MFDVGSNVQVPYSHDGNDVMWLDAVVSAWVDYPSEDGYYRLYECTVFEGDNVVTVSHNLIRKV